jgi:uncharacterized damage-inducible protein DinB
MRRQRYPAEGEMDMELKDIFLEQLESEAAMTRKAIERVPEGRNDWKPHEKSMALGYLAGLVATMPGWVAFTIESDELNFDKPSSAEFKAKAIETRAELLKVLEENVAKGRRALESTTEEHLMKPWRFIAGGRVVSETPRHVTLRDAVFSHLAHHRGQLSVYLRLNGASVPAMYGPSADER